LFITNEFYIKFMIETIGWTFGLFLGQKINQLFILLTTSILGAQLTVIGAFITFGFWPLKEEDADNSTLVYSSIGISVLLSLVGYIYQRKKMLDFREKVKRRLLMEYLALDDEAKQKIQIDKIAQTLDKNNFFYSDKIFNQTYNVDINDMSVKLFQALQDQIDRDTDKHLATQENRTESLFAEEVPFYGDESLSKIRSVSQYHASQPLAINNVAKPTE
jgi:hypothetical protein